MINPTKVIFFFTTVLFSLVLSCKGAHKFLIIYSANDYSLLTPSDEIRILKIDDQMMEIDAEGNTGGSSYSKVAISPGKHFVVIQLLYFREGSVFILEANLEPSRLYKVKYNIGKRIPGTRSWRVNVWIEDFFSGKRVSKINKNF
jgi:hypothetical protein